MQPERFALHFQVPPVTHSATPKLAVLGNLWRPVRPVHIADSRAQRLQLFNQRFERLADSAQRRGALLHQLELDPSLAFRGFAPAHTVILPYDCGRMPPEGGHYLRPGPPKGAHYKRWN